MVKEKKHEASGAAAIHAERWNRICLALEELLVHAEQCGSQCLSRGSDKLYSQIATVGNRLKRIREEMRQSGHCGEGRAGEILFAGDYAAELDAVHQAIEQKLEACKEICGEFSHAETNMHITQRCVEMHENLRHIESLLQERMKYLRISSVY
ncbi:MAG: hypothetical protein JXA20_14470 [Spirochaetes bacterium]|nr:hypothetical protein [Spirochaetota bacterium]